MSSQDLSNVGRICVVPFTLGKLTIHKNDNTLPNGLKHMTNCNILLEEDLQRRWMKASMDAAKVQLDILIEHHTRTLATIDPSKVIATMTQGVQNYWGERAAMPIYPC